MALLALVDQAGVLLRVDVVADSAAVTDPSAGTVALHPNSDIGKKIGRTRYDWGRGAWVDRAGDPLDARGLDPMPAVIAAIDALFAAAGVRRANQPDEWRRFVAAWRRG